MFFRSIDTAGNISEVTTYEVTNIDKVAPEAPTAAADVTAATNQNVTVTAVFSADSVSKEYSFDGQIWKPYTEAIVFTVNGTVLFRGTDEAGNLSEITTCTVDNIDKVAPVKPVASADVTTITNGNVLVSATFSEDSAKKEYSFDGETWVAYTASVKFTKNDIVFFRGTDAAGNVSAVTSYEVTNIDKEAPTAPIASADITTSTNTDVFVSAVFSEDSVKKEYTLDGTTWKAYTTSIRFAENGSVSFRGTDAAGNVSEITSYEVKNIDKVALDKPIATADILVPTNTDVQRDAQNHALGCQGQRHLQ